MADLLTLPCYGEGGASNAIVEAPRGASIKLKYEPALGSFTVARAAGRPHLSSFRRPWGRTAEALRQPGHHGQAAIHPVHRP